MTDKPKLKTSYIANQYGDIIDRYDMIKLRQLGCDSIHALELKKCMDRLLKYELRLWAKENKHIITMPENALEYAYFSYLYDDGRVNKDKQVRYKQAIRKQRKYRWSDNKRGQI